MSTLHPSQAPLSLSDPPLDAITQSLPLVITISLGIVVVLSFIAFTGRSKLPHANPPRWYQTGLVKQFEFMKDGLRTLTEARKRFGKQPYRLIADYGEVLVLPPDYSLMIRNENGLSFSKSIEKNFHAHVNGFEPFGGLEHKNRLVQTVIKKQLTKYLSKRFNDQRNGMNYDADEDIKDAVTEPLSKEATFALNAILGNDQGWKEVVIADSILQLIARLSTKVFLGDEMCRNEAWLKTSKAYTIAAFRMAFQITAIPSILKPLVPWLSKDAKAVAQHLRDGRAILSPMLDERKKIKAEARKKGEPVPEYNDMFEWFENESQGAAYDPATYQMLLSFAAIHTTSDLLSQTMMRLANEPQSIAAIREEIVQVLSTDGLTKAALANLKLMDSALKEAQRVSPGSFLSMRRLAKQKVVLPDGVIIHKGDEVAVDGVNMVDPEIHPEPKKYDIYRYYRMRQDPTTANKAHLVSTGPDNLTFGHGSQSCPGRFFAANEMKIALCHLLLKYDWELGPGASLEAKHTFADMVGLDHENKLRFRRRQEELDLDSLTFT